MMPFTAKTHPGLRRAINEDSYAAAPQLGLWVVADGLGGHSEGEIASAIACEVIERDVSGGASLSSAIEHAHREVLSEIQRRETESNMGTTVVALRLDGRAYEIAWVGDSRAYLFDGQLRQLTTDHSAVNELLQKGAIALEQAANHPQRHALSRSLGVSDANFSDASTISGTLKRGETIFLCTDGITDELSDAEIQSALRMNSSQESQAEALMNAALENGGHDNLTVVLVGGGGKESSVTSPDLETTQNIGEPRIKGSTREQRTSKALLALLVVTIVAAVAGVWLTI